MGFQQPALLGLFVLLPLLTLWARAIRRRRPRVVTTWMLMARAQARQPPTPPSRSLSWRDLLRMLPLLLLVTALARPFWSGSATDAPVVVVLDRSASMGAVRGGASRLRRARAILEDGLPGPWQVVGVPPSGSEALVWDASTATVSADELVDRSRALRAAGRRVIVVTDRPLTDLPDGCGYTGVEGSDVPNLGVTAFGLDADGRLLVRVDGEAAPGASLSVMLEDENGAVVQTLLESGLGPGRVSFRRVLPGVSPSGAQRLRAQLTQDGNPLDDVAVLLPMTQESRVGFPLEGYEALHRAFSAHPGLTTFRGAGRASLRVGDGGGSARLRLWVAPRLPERLSPGEPRPAAGAVDGEGAFRTLSGLRLRLSRLYPLQAMLPSVRTLLRLDGRPLLVVDGRDAVLLADPEGAPWHLEDSFPLAMAALVKELGLVSGGAWRTWRGVHEVEVLGPGASRGVMECDVASVELEADEGAFRAVVERPGVTTLHVPGADGGEWSSSWSTAVLSPMETSAPSTVGADSWWPGIQREAGAGRRDFTPWLLVLAAVVLVALELPPLLRSRG